MKIELDGIDDLMAFVAIIRGEKPDNQTLTRLSEELKDDTTKLLAAEANDSANRTTRGGG